MKRESETDTKKSQTIIAREDVRSTSLGSIKNILSIPQPPFATTHPLPTSPGISVLLAKKEDGGGEKGNRLRKKYKFCTAYTKRMKRGNIPMVKNEIKIPGNLLLQNGESNHIDVGMRKRKDEKPSGRK